jgi:hypothetical protein
MVIMHKHNKLDQMQTHHLMTTIQKKCKSNGDKNHCNYGKGDKII